MSKPTRDWERTHRRESLKLLVTCFVFTRLLAAGDYGPELRGWTPPLQIAELASGNTLGSREQATARDRLCQIRARVSQNLTRQPDYTCVQTVVRLQRRSQSKRFKLLDTLRLEVALIEGKEMFSWPAASRFEADDLREVVPTGSTSSGNFALHARNVFLSEGAEYTYAGQETLHGRLSFRYDYVVPLESSDYLVRAQGHGAVVAVRGSFWADADTLDLVRLEVNADGIPPDLRLESVKELIEYAPVRIGDCDFLLPATAQTTAVEQTGRAIRNETRFSGCRRYTGHSVISFAEPPRAEPEPVAVPLKVVRLPANLSLELQLETPIEEEHSKVGDRIVAVVSSNVTRQGKVIVPKGAVASGRILRLENMPGRQGYHTVALQFDNLEFHQAHANLVAKLEEFRTRFRPGLIVRVARGESELRARKTVQPETPRGVGVFHVCVRAGRLSVPRGTIMTWRTLPIREFQ